MKILHTSDWHLGRTLHGRKRVQEFEAFLNWLLSALDEHRADVLIVAGDVFDTTTPSPVYQRLYYRFLCEAARRAVLRHVVVVGGNHDSPSFLDAPKDLLNFLSVSVVGSARPNPQDELITVRDAEGKPKLLICAVPYLRDRDVRSLDLGAESLQDKERKLMDGIARHYRDVGLLAEKVSSSLGGVPIMGTGHLFAAGGEVSGGDGVRELYIGSLVKVEASLFPECFGYTALGHLHSPQKAGGSEHIRYSGSPFPMSVKEAARGGKRVLLAELPDKPGARAAVTELPVPVFQEMAYVSGDMETLSRELTELRFRDENIWAEIVHEDGGRRVPGLRDRVAELTAGSKVDILKVRDSAETNAGGPDFEPGDLTDIGELNESDVFLRCMERRAVPQEARPELMDTYRRLLASVYEEDKRDS